MDERHEGWKNSYFRKTAFYGARAGVFRGGEVVRIHGPKNGWPRSYLAALSRYLMRNSAGCRNPAPGLGRQAFFRGVKPMDLALLHSRLLMTLLPKEENLMTRRRMARRSQNFFSEVIRPFSRIEGLAKNLTRILARRRGESSKAARRLKQGVLLRRRAEKLLKISGKRRNTLQIKFYRLQKSVKMMKNQLLLTQETERRKNSRRLNNDIAQALIALDLRLLFLKKATRAGALALKKEIANTQRLVRESFKGIHKFAHECDSES